MPNPSDMTPNFVNPAYATPEQLKSLREYSQQLMTGSGQQPVHRWTQGVSNLVNALVGGYEGYRADQMQNEAAARNASDLKALISQLQAPGGKPNPGTEAQIYANPMTSPEQRALIGGLIAPKTVEDVAGRPGVSSVSGGVQALPVQGNFQPGIRVPETAGPGGVSTTTPIPAPMPQRPVPPMVNTPPNAPIRTNPDGSIAGNIATSTGSRIDQLASKARDLSFQQGSNETISNTAKEDISAAMNAPNIKRIAGVMLDDITKHGDKMTFGPTAEWSNNLKKVAANYAPGLMKDQIESLASADSFDKLSAQLTSMLSKGGGTDAQLFNNMKSVPGAHNSQEGAKALLLMVNQVADQQAALREAVAPAKTAQEYEPLRSQFFKTHPIINPITGNPIAMDVKSAPAASGSSGPPIGSIHGGYKFKGGNPNDKANWEPAT